MDPRYIKLDPSHKRIIAVSDIHGNIHLLDKLLKKINYNDNDILVILGDFLQRGSHNLETLNRMMTWQEKENIYILSGNHEHYLCAILEEEHIDRLDYHRNNIDYGCLLNEWLGDCDHTSGDIQKIIKRDQDKALTFLRNLPYALEINNHLFIHGGIDGTYDQSDTWSKLSFPEFMKASHSYEGYLVVGHWPLQNYYENSLSGDIIFDHQKRIIGIDGGYGVIESGQINALIIDKGYETSFEDDLRCIVINADVKKDNEWLVKLDYDDKSYEIIERREEFSLAKKLTTKEVFLIKNEMIGMDFGDYCSYFINADKGDLGKYVKGYGHYALIKHKGKVGWIERKYINYIQD